MVSELQDGETSRGAGAADTPDSAYGGDTLQGSRAAKRWTLIGVYLAILGYGPLYLFVLGYQPRQVLTSWMVGFIIATIAIQLAFAQVFKLRKRSAYPGVILTELGGGQRVDAAARHGLGVIQHLLGVRAAFLALRSGDDGVNVVSVSGMSGEVAGLLLQAWMPEAREAMRSHQPVPFKPAASTPSEPGVNRDERLVIIPVVALQQPIGVLAVAGERRNRDLKDEQLLSSIGVALGLSLENLRQQEEIRESEERLHTVIASTPIVMFSLDREGTFMLAEGKGLDALGFHPSHVLGRSIFDQCRDMPQVLKNVRRALAGEAFTTTLEVNGRVLEAWLSPVWDHNDELSGITGVVTDITERKQAEDALRESEERLRTVVASTPIILYAVNREGVFTLSEGKGLDALGLKPGQVVGQSVFDVYHDVPQIEEKFRRALAGEPLAGIVEVGGVAFETLYTPLRDQSGEISGVIGVATDITERKRADEALRESEAKFRTLTETVAAAAFIFRGARLCYVNSATEALTGYTRDELLAMNRWDVIHPDFREMVRERGLARQRGEDVPRQYECKLLTKGGEERWVDFTMGVIEFEGKPAVLGTAFDVTERKRAEETIKHLAYHDALTSLPNRTLFQDRLTVALAQARRRKRTLAVMFLDLDQFKVVNDTVGHGGGDKLLRSVAERLKGLMREGDTVARVGGDEFAILSSELAHVEDAPEVAERVLEALRRPWVVQGQEFHVTTSIGIALYPGDGDDAETLLRNADTAMYRAKEHGRDNHQLYTPAMNARIAERLAVESSLRHGLERGEFVVHYQPLVNIDTGQVVGTEALVRWKHPERGLVLPAEFIPVAEETGLIVPLGESVLRTACAQNKSWQDGGLPHLRVAVNLSARQFQQRNLIDTVAQVLEDTGLAAHCLQLEITEGVAMQDVDLTIAVLRGLRAMGVQIAMDDFGTGYSSLSYLKLLPVNAVKIDRSFVRDLTTDPSDAAIAAAVIAMAHNLKLNVIAEGVETEEQLALLKQQDCDEMQGYLFSRPAPAEAVEKMLGQGGRPSRDGRFVRAARQAGGTGSLRG